MNQTKILATTVLTAALVPWVAGKAEAVIIKTIDPLNELQQLIRQSDPRGVPSPPNPNPNPAVSNLPNLKGSLLGSNITRKLSLQTQSGRGLIAARIPTANSGSGIDLSSPAGVDAKLTIDYLGTLAGGKFPFVDFTDNKKADRVTLGIILNDIALRQKTRFSITLGSVGKTPITNFLDSDQDYDNKKKPLLLDFLFSSFSGIDPTKINTFSIAIDPPPNGDVSVSILGIADARTTPEPTSVLGLLAVAGTVSMLRKKIQEK